MIWANQSRSTEVLMLGFTIHMQLQHLTFTVFLLMYILTLAGNIVIIVLMRREYEFQIPMYFFLTHLSFLEICYTTTISPNMLDLIWRGQKYISLSGCLFQLYLFLSLACAENFLLAAMAYDRYLAICKPLQYNRTMTNTICRNFAFGCWLGGFLLPVVPVISVYLLELCTSHGINHFFCDVFPVLHLSCTTSHYIQLLEYISASSVLLASCLVIAVSYVCILHAILKIQTSSGRSKAFSTCASHLIVVILFFGPGIIIYVTALPRTSMGVNKWLSLLYTQLTPLLNPFVYCLRNKDVKRALKKSLKSAKNHIFNNQQDFS